MALSGLVVRRATHRDLDVVFVLAVDFAMSFRVEREAFDSSAKSIMADDAAWLAVAEQEGTVLAYCLGFDHLSFYANGRIAWVEEIMVLQDFRRRGIAAALMAEFETWARTRGAKLVALATRRSAVFYEAIGYENSATFFRKILQ